MISTLLEADVGPFELLNVRQVLALGLKSEVTMKVYSKRTVAMVIMEVYFRRAKCDHSLKSLHVGMQPPGHFSAVVFRNRTRKPQFSSFAENVNVEVRIISIFMQL